MILAKVGFFIYLCIFCEILVFWRHFEPKQKIFKIQIRNPKRFAIHENFSIVIATHFERKDSFVIQLKKLISGEIFHLEKIYILWVDSNHALPNLTFFGVNNMVLSYIQIEIIPSTSGFITDRFLIPPRLKTQTVLIMDDDLDIEPKHIEIAYIIYKQFGFQNRIFGTTRRICTTDSYSTLQKGYYNMVLTNFAFINIQMLKIFSNSNYRELRNLTIKLKNCDDILFNFIIQYEFKNSPISLDVPFHDTSRNKGISFQSNHTVKRHFCCKVFQKFFNYSALRDSFFYLHVNSLYSIHLSYLNN